MNNNAKQKEFVDGVVKRLAELTTIGNSTLANRIRHIITQIMNETLDFSNAMRYIHHNMTNSKKPTDIAFWAKVSNIIKEYFATINN